MTTNNKQQVNLNFLLKKTIADYVNDEVKDERGDVFEVLLEQYHDTGAKSYSVKLPNGQKVATFTVAEPKPSERVDEAKLIDWLRDNGYGDQVITKEIPARTEYAIKTGVLGAIGAELTEDGHYVTPAGEIVEGIEQVPAGEPTSFRVVYEGGKKGRQRVVDAWLSGELHSVDAGEVLPQIGGSDTIEGEIVDEDESSKE